MTDTVLIYLLLIVFYLSTCTVVTGRQTFLFASWRRRHWFLGDKNGLIQVRRGVLRGMNPLTPWRLTLMSEDDPLIYDEKGIVCSETQQFIPFTHCDRFSLRGSSLFFGRRLFVEFRNEPAAIAAWDFIYKLVKLPAEERQKLIDKREMALTRTSGVMAKLKLIGSATSCLRWLGCLMMAGVYIAAPVIYCRHPNPVALLSIFVSIIGFHWLVICPLFVVTHARIWKERKGERWVKFAQLFLYPPGGFRLGEEIALPFGMVRAPWVWACLLLSGKAKREFLSKTWRELSYPVIRNTHNEPATSIITEYKRRQLSIFEAALEKRGELGCLGIKTPSPEMLSDGISCYCPRCLGVYIGEKETCTDCMGVKLHRWHYQAH